MLTLTKTCQSAGCHSELAEGFADLGLCPSHYLAQARERLGKASDRLKCGSSVDRTSLEWLLDQVDFIVDLIGTDPQGLTDDQRSEFLQLLLAVANLNEEIRQKSAGARVAIAQGI
jgi:hypothetical protein